MCAKRANKRAKTLKAAQDEEVEEIHSRRVAKRKRKTLVTRRICLVELPYDLILEIFSHLLPLDLLNLCNIASLFHDVLQHRSSTSVWRSARQNAFDMPPPFPGMSESQWAHLAFVKICNFCWAKAVNIPDMHLRTRICPRCSELHLIAQNDLKNSVPVADRPLIDLKFSHLATHLTEYGREKLTDTYAVLTEYEELEEDMSGMTGMTIDELSRTHFSETRMTALEAVLRHTKRALAWLTRLNETRGKEIIEQKKSRKIAILRKLSSLGYEPEMRLLRTLNLIEEFNKHPLANQTRPLSEKVWKNISCEMLKFADHAREKRLAREFRLVVDQRKKHVVRLLRVCKAGCPFDMHFPSLPELYAWTPMKEFLDQPKEVKITLEALQALIPLVIKFMMDWHVWAYGSLLGAAKITGVFPMDECKSLLRRVSNVMLCETCSSILRIQYSLAKVSVLFGEEGFVHSCTRRNWRRRLSYEWVDETLRLGDNYERSIWTTLPLRTNERLTEVALFVVGLISKDGDADIVEIDQRNEMFECRKCGVDPLPPHSEHELLGWRSMIDHVFCKHISDDLNTYRAEVDVLCVDGQEGIPDGWEISRTSEQEPKYACFRCLDSPSEELAGLPLQSVEEHIKNCHDTDEPKLGKHFTLLMGSPMTTRRMSMTIREK